MQNSSLKTVQEELTVTRIRTPATVHYWVDKGLRITQEYRYQTAIEYHKKHALNWVQCEEPRKIENEGFNTQKCNDYELEHKFCRNSYNGLKNYYTVLQIAHAINQLIEKDKLVTAILKLRPKETLRNRWGNYGFIGCYLFFLSQFFSP